MRKPVRLQLSRKKGFDLQKTSQAANGLPASVVARPSKWGNPYPLVEYGREKSLSLYCAYLCEALDAKRLDLSELRNRNLACWCKPTDACHADILLELANA
jgi:hypothetical protein